MPSILQHEDSAQKTFKIFSAFRPFLLPILPLLPAFQLMNGEVYGETLTYRIVQLLIGCILLCIRECHNVAMQMAVLWHLRTSFNGKIPFAMMLLANGCLLNWQSDSGMYFQF